MQSAKKIKRHFVGWGQPMVRQAVAVLTEPWRDGVLDLSDTLILVPTRNAGRRLREALAEAAAARGSAVIPGPVAPPEFLLTARPAPAPPVASASESLAVWTRLLLDLPPVNFPALFPWSRANQSGWTAQLALSTGKKLLRLQSELAENGLSMQEANHRLQASPLQPEPERWAELARLEQLYHEQLAKLQLQDANAVKIKAASQPRLPEDIRKIKVFAVVDPLPLALAALARLAQYTEVEVYIHAPPEEADKFDPWGRPLPEPWQRAEIDIPHAERNLIVVQNLKKQAEQVGAMLERLFTADDGRQPGPVGNGEAVPQAASAAGKQSARREGIGIAADNLAIGLPDPEILPFLEHELGRRGWPRFNPAGTPLRRHPLTALTAALARFRQNPSLQNFAALIRQPAVLEHLRRQDEQLLPADRLLEHLDSIQNEHLPATFSEVKEQAGNHERTRSLHAACQIIERLLPPPAADSECHPVQPVLDALRQLHAHRQIKLGHSEDQLFKQAAEKLVDIMVELESEPIAAQRLPAEIVSGLLENRLQNARVYDERPAAAIDLQGWLELAWEDAPRLIVTGMNEGRVPATVVGDPFLPDSARTVLGLANNHRRFARDAYLMRAMIESRRAAGAVVFIVGKYSARGDPIKPSRLLFLCSDRQLPGRARHLFREISEPAPVVPRKLSWQLQVPAQATPGRLSATSFRDYLACPFRFYLRHVLKMEHQDDTKTELDGLDFGILCHHALEVLGDPRLRGVTSHGLLEKEVLGRLDQLLYRQFGQAWPPPLHFQVESLRQRLRAAARYQAMLHEEGWEVVETECSLQSDLNGDTAAVKVHGRIDRIDRHADGTMRILDYKTAETAVVPEKTLWTTRRGEHTPDYAVLEVDGREKVWHDLQLPLYLLMTRERFPQAPLAAGYFNLPKAITDTQVQVWRDPGPELLEKARQCAVGVTRDIQRKRFWPPADKVQFDEFDELFCDPPRQCAQLNG